MYGFIRCRPIYLFHVLVFYNATRDVFYYIMPLFIYAFLNKHKTNYKRRFIVILSVSHTSTHIVSAEYEIVRHTPQHLS